MKYILPERLQQGFMSAKLRGHKAEITAKMREQGVVMNEAYYR